MKALTTIALVISIICISMLIIASTVNVLAGSNALYRWGFTKYQISEKTGINEVQLTDVGKAMAGYLAGSMSSPQVNVDVRGQKRSVYNQKELVHLKDVREIVWLFQLLQIISIIMLIVSGLVLYLKKDAMAVLNGVKIGAIITLGITGLLVVWSLIDFDSLFYLFHIVSFSNDLWILDPSKDYLIMMFPEGFFNDAAMLMVVSILIAAAILLIAAMLVQKWLAGPVKKAV